MEPPPPIRREAWEGCSVLLDINDGDRLAFFRLTPGASVLHSPASLTSLLLPPQRFRPTLVCAQDGEDWEQDLLAAAARGAPLWLPLPPRRRRTRPLRRR
jgi:hypothetical protein